jgi:hypothetical protein
MGEGTGYQVDVWLEAGEWHATVCVVDDAGNRLDELPGNLRHDYLLNTMSYAGQAISDFERGTK